MRLCPHHGRGRLLSSLGESKMHGRGEVGPQPKSELLHYLQQHSVRPANICTGRCLLLSECGGRFERLGVSGGVLSRWVVA